MVQLAAVGPQERGLYPAPPPPCPPHAITRHTRFATETRAEVFPNSCVFGASNVMDIPRLGDLLGDITLEITLPVVPDAAPTDAWVDAIGYVLLRRMQLAVDDTIIHDHERLWYDISDRLFTKQSRLPGLHEMIGKGKVLLLSKAHTLYVPLKFFCCKGYHTRQTFMPLLGTPGSTLRLGLQTESFAGCVRAYAGSAPPTEIDVKVLLDYVTVDAPERERILRRPTPLLIEDVHDCESLSFKMVDDHGSGGGMVPLDAIKVDLSEINSPVKMIAWVTYTTNDLSANRYFEYTGDITSSTLRINGQDLVAAMPEDYFRVLEKYYYVDRTEPSNVHVYSFALDASSWQPSGHLNFEKAHRPELCVSISAPRTDLVVKAFVLCYKHIIFDKGRAMMMFV